jgi:short-subunit dehydrogenase
MINAVGTPQSLLLLGGTSDIALAIAHRYARPGLRIVLAARPSDRRTAAATELKSVGCEVTEVDLEARDHGSHTATIDLAFAGERVRRSNFVYGSTKAGLDGFFLGLGEALRDHGVRVLVVRPGFVKSKMTAGLDEIPLSVTPDDVAEAITDAIQSKRELIWVPGPLRAVMSGLRHVPRPLFRKLPL